MTVASLHLKCIHREREREGERGGGERERERFVRASERDGYVVMAYFLPLTEFVSSNNMGYAISSEASL